MDPLLWLDMEMTGLDVEKEVIIEVAALVTNNQLEVTDTFETVIKQPQKYLDAMDEWNKNHHAQSGLLAKIPFGMDPYQAEDELVHFIKKNFAPERGRPILAGNSIMQDRLFINKHMPRLASMLHYRMVDVTSWKIIMQGQLAVKYQKSEAHRALDDVHESLEELKFYLSFVQKKNFPDSPTVEKTRLKS